MDKNFNPRARAGRDGMSLCKGAPVFVFQSTRPCGARPLLTDKFPADTLFQSTRPCGARRASFDVGVTRIRNFNPRARAGRDDASQCRSDIGRNFNPRARAGRDLRTGSGGPALGISIHAPVRGATHRGPGGQAA